MSVNQIQLHIRGAVDSDTNVIVMDSTKTILDVKIAYLKDIEVPNNIRLSAPNNIRLSANGNFLDDTYVIGELSSTELDISYPLKGGHTPSKLDEIIKKTLEIVENLKDESNGRTEIENALKETEAQSEENGKLKTEINKQRLEFDELKKKKWKSNIQNEREKTKN